MRHLLVRRLAWLVPCLASACAHPRPSPAVPAPPDVDTQGPQLAVTAFVASEARGSADADTLLATGADFVMTGVSVTARPRLAGFNGPGTATIEQASTETAGTFAWVVAVYRFTARTPELNERARATFILEKQRAGWKIRHVHSSMVTRW